MRHFFVRTMTEEKKKRIQLSPAKKAEAVHLWRTGQARNAKELAQRMGCSLSTMTNLFVKLKIKKGDLLKTIEKKQEAIVAEATTIMLDPAVHARRVFDTKNETYRIVEMLRKLVIEEVVKSRQAGLPMGSVQNNMKAIREAAAAIKVCREEAYAVLGVRMDEQGDEALPELRITGLDDDQIEELQNQMQQEGMGDIPDLPSVPDEDEEAEDDV